MIFHVALALLAQMPEVTPLRPSGKWQVDYGESGCLLAREFGEGGAKVHFGLNAVPTARGYDMIVQGPGEPLLNRRRPVLVSINGSSPVIRKEWTTTTVEPGIQRSTIHVDTDLLAGASQPVTLTVQQPTGQSTALLLDQTTTGLTELATCTSSLAAAWGVSPDALDRIATPAIPIGGTENWPTPDDYPLDAFRSGHQGKVGALWRIGSDGRVSDCRVVASSGYSDLDAGTCAAIVRRAKYKPARDNAGNAVTSTSFRLITWVNPNAWAIPPKRNAGH